LATAAGTVEVVMVVGVEEVEAPALMVVTAAMVLMLLAADVPLVAAEGAA
jgi:hypothetical protein